MTLPQRARAMLDIAAPEHREMLRQALEESR